MRGLCILGSLLASFAVLVLASESAVSGDWKMTAIAGIGGTCLNCLFVISRTRAVRQLEAEVEESRERKAQTKATLN
jgi:hypothetical protein